MTLATVQGRAHGIAVDATHVYWTSGFGTVMKVALDGGAPKRLALAQNGADAIVIDAASAYWANYSLGTVMKVALTGGVPRVLAVSQQGPIDIALQGGRVYWANAEPSSATGGTIARVGAGATTVAHRPR